MATLNIRRDVQDQFYRYKMPRLQSKIEGKGNGIKTVVPNMSDIARALSRPPSYITKFFGCELGAQTPMQEKDDRYIVNGAHDASKLQDLLDVFIAKFVLCPSCKNPETDLIITKDQMIVRDCKACGQRGDVDLRHKLTTYIFKNPPEQKKKSKKGDNGTSRNGRSKAAATASALGDGEENGDSDDELTKQINEEAAQLPAPKAADDDDHWAVDTSEEAVKARVRALESGIKSSLVIGGDDDEDDGAEESPYEVFGIWVSENKDASDVDIFRKAQELGIERKHRAVQVLVQCIFDGDILKKKQIDKRAAVIKKMLGDGGEKHQKSLLGGIERLVGIDYPDLISGVPSILMQLYEYDLLDEEIVTNWGTHVSKKYVDKDTSKRVRRAAEPFLKWLAEAESDESDAEDDD